MATYLQNFYTLTNKNNSLYIRHEGRVWYSALRGRLWIASTSKPPVSQDIQAVENSLRILRKGES